MKYLNLLLFLFISISCYSSEKINSEKETTHHFDFLSTVELPKSLSFCGENYPLDDPEIRERAEREFYLLLQQPGQIILYLKRSGRYFPIFEKYFKSENVPDDLKYLSVAESALYMSRSSAGAIGLWQFMPATARAMGLVVNDFVDERRHPEKSTQAAIKYLKQGYRNYKSWILAAAGYNMGHENVVNNMDFQYSNDYFELFLNEETSRYLFRIAIIKEIMQHPDKYGFNSKTIEKYKPYNYNIKTVNNEINDLSAWAKVNGTTYKLVKMLNPWILKRNLPKPSKGSNYQIALPK